MTRLLVALLFALAPAAQSTGRIAGHVSTTDDPGQQLARAYVSLIGVDSQTRRLTMTRDDGTFVFDGLAPGRYIVEAGKLPYLAADQRVTVGAGHTGEDLTFRLKRSGVITGHIFDERGEPARQITVSALQIRYERGGVRNMLATGHSSVTDRSGRFRLHGLPPGAYTIATSGSPIGGLPPLPGVTHTAATNVFVIDDGSEHNNVTTHLIHSTAPPASMWAGLSGTVLGTDGQPTEADVTVSYTRGSIGLPGSGSGSSRTRTSGGQFRFNSVMPGAMRISAMVAGQPLRAVHDLTLEGGRAAEITLRLQPPIDIVGRATNADTFVTPPPLVVTGDGAYLGETRTIDVPPSGEFKLSLFPGRYLIPNPSLVLVDGVDMTDRVFEVRHDRPIKNLVVTFGGPRQSITGHVLNTDGVGVNTVTMVAFSATETDWFHDSRRIAIATPSTDGRYELADPQGATLPAGEYYLAAVADLSPDEHYNPAFLKTLIPAALRITLGAGEQKVQDVRVR